MCLYDGDRSRSYNLKSDDRRIIRGGGEKKRWKMNANVFMYLSRTMVPLISTVKKLHVSRRLTFCMRKREQVWLNLLATVLYSAWPGCSSTTQTSCCFMSLQCSGILTAKRTFEDSHAPGKAHLRVPGMLWRTEYHLRSYFTISWLSVFKKFLVFLGECFSKCGPQTTYIRTHRNAC